ncbi:hypothetical protein K469DRAFT_713467 [Zopfia rhizophila CBS 207.26]|uniref:MFS general substrate transporter n=1 Tax=Zopfia rhizophila CBS 207.26 TaxID=1314779 RepID=A0A6A6DS29_9PEZI|nr:hypothetical protein K469DRAFT_713467 [Zopfia rhizophila CBS 207.26]
MPFAIEKVREGSTSRDVYLHNQNSCDNPLGYGWSLEKHAHVSIPLVLRFFISTSVTAVFNAYGTLLVEINPDHPATVSATSNLFRCILAAAGLAALDPLITALSPRWYFAVFTAILLITAQMAYFLQSRGVRWRQNRTGIKTGEEHK